MQAAVNSSHCSKNSGRKKSGYVFATTFPSAYSNREDQHNSPEKKLQWLLVFFFNMFCISHLPSGACSGAEVLSEPLGISPGQWGEAASGASEVFKGEKLKAEERQDFLILS